MMNYEIFKEVSDKKLYTSDKKYIYFSNHIMAMYICQ